MEGVGIEHKEVGPKGLANEKQLLCVDAGLVEESLQGPFRHTDALHQPFICVLLASQFATDQTADVDLHSGLLSARLATDSLDVSNVHKKREANLSRLPVCGRGNYLSKERPKCPPHSEHLPLSPLEPCLKFSTFQTGSEQIANAMLLNM